MSTKYWSIEYFDTGSSLWIRDTSIPRAGINSFSRTNQSNTNFNQLVDGTLTLSTSEHKANWQEIGLLFPKQIVTDDLITQLKNYVDNNYGVRITVPIKTGASLYSERKLEGYLTQYIEQWHVGSSTQEYTIEIIMHEFDVDADNSLT